MRTDFHNIEDGQPVLLHPSDANFLHRSPVRATRHGFGFYCAGSDPKDRPDYTIRDVGGFCRGWEAADEGVAA